MTAADAYLAHIISRIESDVDFLVQQNALSQADARAITAKLSAAAAVPTPASTPSVTSPMSSVLGAFKRSTPASTPPATMPKPEAPASEPVMVEALWDWEDQDGNDLSFRAGDRIELVEETNDDWWTGKMGAQSGLFPANYVKKLPQHPTHTNHRASAHLAPNPTYKAANLNHYRAPPPPSGSYDPMAQPPPATNAVGLTQPAVDEKKKSKFGGLGKTMANSAAGGVGFGAGAAIGGGLVRAIF